MRTKKEDGEKKDGEWRIRQVEVEEENDRTGEEERDSERKKGGVAACLRMWLPNNCDTY